MMEPDALAIKQAAEVELFALPGVRMVGFGFKWVGGVRTDVKAILVFVERKLCADEVPVGQMIPATFDALPTDVEELGEIRQLAGNPRKLDYEALEKQHRPLIAGVRITNVRTEAKKIAGQLPGEETVTTDFAPFRGTLGCFVKTRATVTAPNLPNRICALTNHHVVNPQHVGGSDAPGRIVFQPEPVFDGTGRPVPLDKECSCKDESQQNKLMIGRVMFAKIDVKVDAALVALKGGLKYDPRLLDIPGLIAAPETLVEIKGSRPKVLGEEVYKIGEGTFTTVGKIIADAITTDITDDFGIFRKAPTGSFFIEPTGPAPDPGEKLRFDEEGDSGSALMAKSDNKVVGLLWGGRTILSGPHTGERYGIADPIEVVENEMQCDVLPFNPADPAPEVDSDNLEGIPTLDTAGNPVVETSVAERAREAAIALRARPSSDRVPLLERHVAEVSAILHANRQARIRWIRKGGPLLAGICLDGITQPESKLPSEDGLSLTRRAIPVLEGLLGEGSESLDASLKTLLPLLRNSKLETFGELADAVLDSL